MSTTVASSIVYRLVVVGYCWTCCIDGWELVLPGVASSLTAWRTLGADGRCPGRRCPWGAQVRSRRSAASPARGSSCPPWWSRPCQQLQDPVFVEQNRHQLCIEHVYFTDMWRHLGRRWVRCTCGDDEGLASGVDVGLGPWQQPDASQLINREDIKITYRFIYYAITIKFTCWERS